ncbi:regulatory protein [Streptomyces azureus]|uniref:Regulatory protein n=1 Tax=Streptomyces azureus TaxID=146537 RepID=A0A0K8PI41_STRAJ|nr:regulatory protein [Streptomyces azureus]
MGHRSDAASACPAGPGWVGQYGLEVTMAVCRSFEVRREPVGKCVKAAIVLADDPGGDPAGRLL